ncbi:MAG: putative DNA binding domain-containing protein [Magnetococcales bacterium]|nr:putative DNA binding domain-containing protein [Magnetococcales bacterium]
MTRTDLLEIIRNGENSGVEFKRDVIQNHELARELVAFSNHEGGMVLLGVEDDGQVSGITRPDVEEWVMTACRDKIRPAIIPFFEVVRNVESGKDVGIVRVTHGFDVHTLRHHNQENYVIRVGSQSRDPTREELARLFQQRGHFRVELRPVSGATLADLDLRRLQDYFAHVREQEVPADHDTDAWNTLLYNTELRVDEGVTVAGILLFGRNPNRFLPQAGIHAVAYPGHEKDYASIERQVMRGPMTPLLSRDNEIVESGLVEQALAFVRRNTPVLGQLEAGGGRREEIPCYPPEVIREAVVNALVHRDYLFSGTDIELSIYADRLEIVSPGRLPNGITITRMLTGCRLARNTLLVDVMRDYRYLERSGMGVPRKIVKGMLKHNGTRPGLIAEEEQFTVRLLRGTGPL